MFTVIRCVIALVLLICGSLWLANEKSIENLVLNAAALEFVLAVDETFYSVFVPKVTRSLLENMEPTTLRLNKTISGVGVQLFVYVFLILVLVGSMGQLKIIPLQINMETINRTLCDGKLDFVVGVQLATGQLFSGELPPLEEENGLPKYGIAMNAVHRIKEKYMTSPEKWDNGEQGTETDVLNNNAYASILDGRSLQGTINVALGEYVSQARHRCRDRNLENDPPRLNAIKDRTKLFDIGNRATCTDFKDKCDSFRSGTLVRFLCPHTCKCGMPRAGLYLDGPMFGCARGRCREEERSRSALAALPCTDEEPKKLNKCVHWLENVMFKNREEMLNTTLNDKQADRLKKECRKLDPSETSLTWILFWNQYFEYWGNRSPFYRAQKEAALTKGCNFKDLSYVCDETGAVASVRTYCPVTCGCRKQMSIDCPTTCSKYSAPIIAGQIDEMVKRSMIEQGLFNMSN